ncbi:MAG: VOC family protein [Jatrophihabitantaceae bacterium]
MTAPAGAPCWIDLLSSDTQRIREFYGSLFGWTAGEASPEFGGYFMFFKDGVPVAGAMGRMPGMDLPDQWGIYLAVEDARKSVEAALASGASLRDQVMDVADLGTSAVIEDPGGATIGLWQAKSFGGFGVSAQDGTPGWFELHTRSYEQAVAFYRDVLGWDTHTQSDTPEFRYTTLGADQHARAGIMDASGMLPPETPSHWSVYFAADDTDATLARATELGASVVRPAEDTPYGRLAVAADPTGAQFKLVGPSS